MANDTKAISDVDRLSQLFLSNQKINLYWKCPSNKKIADFMDYID